jgi:broad specificity phosphatase PhoE
VPASGGSVTERRPEVWIVRHGQTEWSESGRHTSYTDVELTEEGARAAVELGARLASEPFERVLTSPLSRAHRTCELAGFGEEAVVDERLKEWQYGAYEGITTAEIREDVPGFSVWTHPIPDGEPLEAVGVRTDSLIADLRRTGGPVLVFAHGHLLRVLAARWMHLPPVVGAHLELAPATISVLGWERETPTLQRWNA